MKLPLQARLQGQASLKRELEIGWIQSRGKTSCTQTRRRESERRGEVGTGDSKQLPAQWQAVAGAAHAPDAPTSQTPLEEACEGGRS